MTLTKKTLEYYEEDDLNELIEETFGKEYSIQQSGDMCSNDTWNYFICWEPGFAYNDAHEWVQLTVEQEEQLIADWVAAGPNACPGREPDPYAATLLTALHRRGLLEIAEDKEGIYVHVSW